MTNNQIPKIEVKEKFSIAANLVRALVFASLSFVLVTATFFAEGYFVDKEAETGVVDLSYERENVLDHHGILRFNPKVENNLENGELFKVNLGEFWVNFFKSNFRTNFVFGDRVLLIPNHAVFDLKFDGNKLDLSVFDGDVYVQFLQKGVPLDRLYGLYDSVYMNSLLVPRGSKVSVLIDRVDERFSDLFYSKLIKEFKLSQITDSDLKEEFVAENIARDRVYFDELERKTSSNILSRGKTVSDSMFSGIYMWFQENFTLFESKKEQWHADRKQAYLQDAVYYADTNQVDKSVEALQSFNSLNGGFREDMFDEEFLLYSVDDPKYLVSMNVLEQAYLAGYERSVLNELWLDVYEAISINNVFAEKSLQKYFKYLDKYLANNDLAPVELELFLAYQNQLLRNLFIKSPVMYKEEYLLKKYDLERELLGNYDEFLRKDLSQDYVNYKIIYIKRLMKFFFDDEIKVSDAAAALSRLVKEINELMPQETSTKALFEFFDEQLKDIGDFWGYLKSPEYNSTRVYGATHKERYEVYLEERQKLWSFIDVQQEVIGEVLESELSVDDIEAEVRAVFDQNENIKSLILGSILSADQRYVEVKGNILGYSFEADYDRDFEALVNVFVYGELISEDPVKLENLIRVVEQRFSELTDVEVSDDEDDLTQIETHAQRVARIYIAGVIEKAGFVLDESNVGLIDTGKSLYAISNVYLEGYDDILVTFDYNATKELSENLYFVYKDKPIVLEDRYSLVQIKEMIREGIENLDQYDDKQPRSRAVSR